MIPTAHHILSVDWGKVSVIVSMILWLIDKAAHLRLLFVLFLGFFPPNFWVHLIVQNLQY